MVPHIWNNQIQNQLEIRFTGILQKGQYTIGLVYIVSSIPLASIAKDEIGRVLKKYAIWQIYQNLDIFL